MQGRLRVETCWPASLSPLGLTGLFCAFFIHFRCWPFDHDKLECFDERLTGPNIMTWDGLGGGGLFEVKIKLLPGFCGPGYAEVGG